MENYYITALILLALLFIELHLRFQIHKKKTEAELYMLQIIVLHLAQEENKVSKKINPNFIDN